MMGTISALLSTTVFGAGAMNCAGGVCFVKLDNLQVSKGFEKKNNALVILDTPRFIEDKIDKTVTIVLDGEEITVFPSYVMTEEEKVNYIEEENEELLRLTQTVEIEDKILEKTNLPTSEYFCEKNTKPLYNNFSHSYQCVS